MKIFLLWLPKSGSDRPNGPAAVAARLEGLFADLFQGPLQVRHRRQGGCELLWMELPVAGFSAPFWEDRGADFAAACEYPWNVRRVLRDRNAMPAAGEPVLVELADQLRQHPTSVLTELIPPFGLVTGCGDEVRVHNDGLGMAQLYEAEDDQGYYVTNRVMALAAAGFDLRPDARQWATRFVTGWFLGTSTGYDGVRYLAPGTELVLSAGGVQRRTHNVLQDWVQPGQMSVDESLELGRASMLSMLEDAVELAHRPSVGLSGGWDSRAVVASLRHLQADFELRVRGSETNFDVMISCELARIARLPLRVKVGGGIPQDSLEGCRSSIGKALRWQAGSYVTLKHKNFLAKAGKDRLDGGVVNVMGQHGGVGKADFAVKIRAHDRRPEQYEGKLLDKLLRDAPVYLRPELHESVREDVRAAYRVAGDFGLEGLGPLHFFFLHEYTRRWGSATVNGQTGIVVAPFLNPGMIRACYAYPAPLLPQKPMHRFITETLAPDWRDVPYEDQVTEEDITSGRVPPVPAKMLPRRKESADDLPDWRRVKRRHHKFGYRYYWKAVGRPLVEEALAAGGFWTEIFDPELAGEHWLDAKTGGDLISIAHLLPKVVAAARGAASAD
jgi:hypothetical protein